MTTEINEAWDTLVAYLEAEWPGVSNPIATVPLVFADTPKADIPNSHFARFSMQPATERQRTFRNGTSGSQRYTSTGVLYLQIFVLRTDAKAAELRRRLAHVGKVLLRGQSFDGCIWTRNAGIRWLDPEPKFLKANVVADYEWDEQG